MLKRRMAIGERFEYRDKKGNVVHVTVLGIKRNGEVELGIESDLPIDPADFSLDASREVSQDRMPAKTA